MNIFQYNTIEVKSHGQLLKYHLSCHRKLIQIHHQNACFTSKTPNINILEQIKEYLSNMVKRKNRFIAANLVDMAFTCSSIYLAAWRATQRSFQVFSLSYLYPYLINLTIFIYLSSFIYFLALL